MKIDLANTDVGGFNFEFLRLLSSQTAGAAEIGECLTTIGRVKSDSFESWITEWRRTAARVATVAGSLLQRGDRVGARCAFLRASNYYRAAEFYATHDDPRQTEAWTLSRETFLQAAALTSPLVERIEIPFEDAQLPGYFVRGGEGKRATLIAMSGFDGSAEELYFWLGPAAAERGWNCLLFEGLGQRGALHLNPGLVLRPDYEVPVSAVVDYALGRAEVDGERLALIGYSLGGFLATRAAAYEPRIRACIANSLVVDVGGAFAAVWPKVLRADFPKVVDAAFSVLSHLQLDTRWGMDQARWAMGVEHAHDFFDAWAPYSLWGTEDRMQTPLLCMVGEDEIAQTSTKMALDTARYLGKLKSDVQFHFFPRKDGASSHCQMGGLQNAQAAIFTWLNETLCPDAPSSQPTPHHQFRIPDELMAAIKKHHPKFAI
jgi:pimeloyl-ACP methyl ester carboxylesterase